MQGSAQKTRKRENRKTQKDHREKDRCSDKDNCKGEIFYCEFVPYIPTPCEGVNVNCDLTNFGCSTDCYPKPEKPILVTNLSWLAVTQFQKPGECPKVRRKCINNKTEKYQPVDCNDCNEKGGDEKDGKEKDGKEKRKKSEKGEKKKDGENKKREKSEKKKREKKEKERERERERERKKREEEDMKKNDKSSSCSSSDLLPSRSSGSSSSSSSSSLSSSLSSSSSSLSSSSSDDNNENWIELCRNGAKSVSITSDIYSMIEEKRKTFGTRKNPSEGGKITAKDERRTNGVAKTTGGCKPCQG